MMTEVLDMPVEEEIETPPALYQVWIDANCGTQAPDWWWNSAPKPLKPATEEWLECLGGGWIAKLLPEGQNPRADGRWDNP